jgi:hypothetical protein
MNQRLINVEDSRRTAFIQDEQLARNFQIVCCAATKSPGKRLLMGRSGRAPAPPAIEAGEGRRRQGARHIPESQLRGCRHRPRHPQELVPHRRSGLAAVRIVLRHKWSRSQIQARLANIPRSARRPALVLQKGTLSGRKGSNGASSQKSNGLFKGNSNLRSAPPYDTARPFDVISFNY